MVKLNPVEKSQYIDKEYKRLLRSSFKFDSDKLQELFKKQLEVEELFKGPYVDLILPFKRGKSLQKLIDENLVCKSFAKLGGLNLNRPLYAHQEDALRLIGSGHSAVVTTGTGSGKTECFLYPILNDILKDIENGNKEIGVRAIFLYPMNALVNDQIERIRGLLSQCPEITYGFYTGDTKETVSRNYRNEQKSKTGITIPENELVSREEIRHRPPHILFTNFSMLEYLLIRPNDYSIISSEHLKNWKYVVLDEAHTYHGSLGIEISMLMRRLTGLTDKKPRFILTSATLGEKGKSENDIVKFAQNLTSAKFSVDDIIFSKRIPFPDNMCQYAVSGNDYLELKQNIKNLAAVQEICYKYLKKNFDTVSQCLYELLIRDKNTLAIYNILKNGSKKFKTIVNRFFGSLQDKEIIALIDLINASENNGIGLFDLKYHSFVRPIAGAYINLGKEHKLTLTKTNMLEGLKAFEVGNCRYCSAPYIIGKIRRNLSDNIDYLFQNNEVDIYENYGENENVQLDYFILEDTYNKEGIDPALVEEEVLCSKCGAIHAKNIANPTKCKCDDKFAVTIYKIIQKTAKKEPRAYNNINFCPCCGHRNPSGIVKSLNIGKDEGTALIGQILYEAIDEGDSSVSKKKKVQFGKSKKDPASEITGENKIKQFLQFSDSRQQASFAATFMDFTHVKMLRKRLLWKMIEDHNFEEISVDTLLADLAHIIKEYDLFDNKLTNEKEAWVTVLIDLLKVDGVFDGEGLGLYFFDLDLDEMFADYSDEDIRDTISEECGINTLGKQDLISLMQVVFSTFKLAPAIDSSKSGLTIEEKEKFLSYRSFDNYVEEKCSESKKNVRSWLPINSGSNTITRYVEKACNCGLEESKKLLDLIFNFVKEYSEENGNNGIFIEGKNKGQYQIRAGAYRLKNYKKCKYYACKKCGALTPHNVNGACIHDRCDGKLEEINPDEKLAMNYYREKYKTKKIERVIFKEHTAQLDREEAKQYQEDFKNKKINILSCSTTFEMGIDIGDLETVFMRNVPPSPANYVQRAGRAGRRKDSSAYILTYCSTSSHDYTYFNDPLKMISGMITPPYFDVLNKKIIIRHLMAASLGYFFRENQDYFKSIEGLAFQGGDKLFYAYLKSNPEKLNQYINEKIIPEKVYDQYRNFKWFHEMDDIDEKMSQFVEQVQNLAEEYKKAMDKAISASDYSQAAYYQGQLESLKREKVLDDLSKYCVIPKYGFPVDLVELQIYSEKGTKEAKYDLTRDLKIAISEYAPDSEVIVDKKKYTSKYITMPKTHEFPRRYFYECKNCENINVFVSNDTDGVCKYCGNQIPKKLQEYFIEPRYGFKTGETKKTTQLKPKRSYSGEVKYIGEGQKDENSLSINNVITIETSSNDKLLVMNRSKFYVCRVCGFSKIGTANNDVPQIAEKHKKYNSHDCENEILQGLKLAHQFQTDVAKFTIPRLSSLDERAKGKALSFMYAFLAGISDTLDIEENDINGILSLDSKNNRYDIIIYDDVPGGAGHVKRLVNKEAIIKSLEAALVKVSQNCCDENTSCYNCLRNYYNQRQHNKLKRIYAKDIICDLLNLCKD